MQAIGQPERTIMFMTFWQGIVSAYGWWLNYDDRTTQVFPYRNNTQANVIFVDGHVRLMTKEELAPPAVGTANSSVKLPWAYNPSR